MPSHSWLHISQNSLQKVRTRKLILKYTVSVLCSQALPVFVHSLGDGGRLERGYSDRFTTHLRSFSSHRVHGRWWFVSTEHQPPVSDDSQEARSVGGQPLSLLKYWSATARELPKMIMNLIRSHIHLGIVMYTPHHTFMHDHSTIPKMEGPDEHL